MSIYELIKKDHRTVKQLFKAIARADNPNSEFIDTTFQKINDELSMHMTAEEKLFYPPLAENEKSKSSTLEAMEEHTLTKQLLQEIAGVSKDDTDHRLAKIKVLRELVETHISEEESTIFDYAHDLFDRAQANELADKFQNEKSMTREPAMSSR